MKNEVHFNELNLEKKSSQQGTNLFFALLILCMRACDFSVFLRLEKDATGQTKWYTCPQACVLSHFKHQLLRVFKIDFDILFSTCINLECFLVPGLKFQFPIFFQEKYKLYSFVPGWKSISLNEYDNVNRSIFDNWKFVQICEIRSCLNCRYTVSLSFITWNWIFYVTNLLEFTPGNMCTKVLFMAYCFYLRIRGYYWLPCICMYALCSQKYLLPSQFQLPSFHSIYGVLCR